MSNTPTTDVNENQGRGARECFIATAVYGHQMAPEVVALRQFRDETLRKYWLGNKFIAAYYRLSPPVASWLRTKPMLSGIVRHVLDRLVRQI